MIEHVRSINAEERKSLDDFAAERKRQFDSDRPHGLRPTPDYILRSGWKCPNCGGAHGPHVMSCPEPSKDASLRNRLGM